MKLPKRQLALTGLSIFLTFASQANGAAPGQEVMERLLKLRTFSAGPNCWNAALQTAGLYPYTLLTSEYTARALFERNCERLGVEPAAAPAGSLLRYVNGAQEVHAFVAYGEGKFFQKRDTQREGPYEIVSLAEVDQHYGRDALCAGQAACAFRAEVLDCTRGPRRPLRARNAELDALLSVFSRLITEESQAKQEGWQAEAKGHVAKLLADKKSFAREARRSPDEAFLLLDLAQSNRFLDHPGAAGFKAEMDRALWDLFTELANSMKLSVPLATGFVDFAYGAKAPGENPQRLIDRLVKEGARLKLTNGREEALALRIALYANPNFTYASAEAAVEEGLGAFEVRPSERLFGALGTYLRFAAGGPGRKGEQLSRLAGAVLSREADRPAELVEFATLLVDSALLPREKRDELLRRALVKADERSAEEIRNYLSYKEIKL